MFVFLKMLHNLNSILHLRFSTNTNGHGNRCKSCFQEKKAVDACYLYRLESREVLLSNKMSDNKLPVIKYLPLDLGIAFQLIL